MNQQDPTGLRPLIPYPVYKDSGIEWLGKIPGHWDAVPLKRLLTRCDYGISESLAGTGDVRVLTMAHIQDGEVILPGSGSVSEIEEELILDRHDLLFNRTNSRELVGKVGIFRGSRSDRVSFASYLVRMTAREGISSTYLNFLLNSSGLLELTRSMAMLSVNQANLNPTRYTQIRVPLPGLREQEAIAGFLDRETATIDALVAKKERLIELLEEKRTALITWAVTEGFDSKAPTKSTGVASFPKIPSGWSLTKLRRLISQVSRPVRVEPAADYQEIGIRSWGKGLFHKDPLKGAQLEDKSVFYIKPGDLVLNIVFAWEGAVGVVSEAEEGMVASHRFPTFRHAADQVNLDYLLMFLQSEHGRGLMGLNSPGAAGRNRTIRLSSFLSEEIPIPPLNVQREIVRTFRAKEQLLSVVGIKARTLMDRLLELRTALISAAVTGKIDVRPASTESTESIEAAP